MPTIKVPDSGHPRLYDLREIVDQAMIVAKEAGELAREAQLKASYAASKASSTYAHLHTLKQALDMYEWRDDEMGDEPVSEFQEKLPPAPKPDPELTKEQQYALDHLHEGEPAGSQPLRVKSKLRDLEQAGVVRFDKDTRNWHRVTRRPEVANQRTD